MAEAGYFRKALTAAEADVTGNAAKLEEILKRLLIERVHIVDTSTKGKILREMVLSRTESLVIEEIARAREAERARRGTIVVKRAQEQGVEPMLDVFTVSGSRTLYIGKDALVTLRIPSMLLRRPMVPLKIGGIHIIWGIWERQGMLGFFISRNTESIKGAVFTTLSALQRNIVR